MTGVGAFLAVQEGFLAGDGQPAGARTRRPAGALRQPRPFAGGTFWFSRNRFAGS